jgi:hypothetical protein
MNMRKENALIDVVYVLYKSLFIPNKQDVMRFRNPT